MSVSLSDGLATALQRIGLPAPEGLERLSGGANMESWRFSAGGETCVLRRAPSLEMMAGRPMDHAGEAALIRAARAAGVMAPEVLVELETQDGIGSGYIMRAIAGSPDPRCHTRCRSHQSHQAACMSRRRYPRNEREGS